MEGDDDDFYGGPGEEYEYPVQVTEENGIKEEPMDDGDEEEEEEDSDDVRIQMHSS